MSKKGWSGAKRGLSELFGRKKSIGSSSSDLAISKERPVSQVDLSEKLAEIAAFLEANGLDVEGLFRISGQQSMVQSLKHQYDSGNPVDLSPFAGEPDIHVVTSLLKLYLRELTDPLLTFELYDGFIAAEGVTDFTSKLSCVKNLLNSLPPNNVHILSKLMVLLHKVYKHSHINKMSSSNLAIVIAPNVLRRQVQTMETIITDTPLITSIVETMIMECPMLFDVSIPVADSASKSSPPFVTEQSDSSKNPLHLDLDTHTKPDPSTLSMKSPRLIHMKRDQTTDKQEKIRVERENLEKEIRSELDKKEIEVLAKRKSLQLIPIDQIDFYAAENDSPNSSEFLQAWPSTTNEQLAELTTVIDVSFKEVKASIENLRRELARVVKLCNVNGVLLIGKIMQAIKRLLSGDTSASNSLSQQDIQQLRAVELPPPSPSVIEKLEKLQSMLLLAFEDITEELTVLYNSSLQAISSDVQEEACTNVVETVHLIRSVQQLLNCLHPTDQAKPAEAKNIDVLRETIENLTLHINVNAESSLSELKDMYSFEQARYITQVLRIIKTVLQTPLHEIRNFQYPSFEVPVVHNPAMNEAKLESLRKVIGLVFAEITDEVFALQKQAINTNVIQTVDNIGEMLKAVKLLLDTIVDEQALVKKQLAYSSEVALIEKDGEEKMRTIAVETLASLMNELSTEKAEIMTTTSLLKIVQFSQKIRNIKKLLMNPEETNIGQLVITKNVDPHEEIEDSAKKIEILRKLILPLFSEEVLQLEALKEDTKNLHELERLRKHFMFIKKLKTACS